MFENRPFLKVEKRQSNQSPPLVTLSDDEDDLPVVLDENNEPEREVIVEDPPARTTDEPMAGTRQREEASTSKRKAESDSGSVDSEPGKRAKLENVGGNEPPAQNGEPSTSSASEVGKEPEGSTEVVDDDEEAERRSAKFLAAFQPLPSPLGKDELKAWKLVESKIRHLPNEMKLSQRFLNLISLAEASVEHARASDASKWFFAALSDPVRELKAMKKDGGIKVTVPMEFLPKARNGGKLTPVVASVVRQLEDKRLEAEILKDEQKRTKTIAELEKCMRRLIAQRQKLEELEVDFEDDSQSAYCQVERIDKRILKVDEKIKNLKREEEEATFKKIRFNGTEWRQVNRKVEKVINVDGMFPDYHDIVKILKDCRTDGLFQMDDDRLGDNARKIFSDVGKILKKRRYKETQQTFADYEEAFRKYEADIPKDDPVLETKLQENARLGEKKMQELCDSFVKKQEDTGAEAVEVPEELACLSDYEVSGDEDDDDDDEEDDDDDDDEGEIDLLDTESVAEEAQEEPNEDQPSEIEEEANPSDLVEPLEENSEEQPSLELNVKKENDASIESSEVDKENTVEEDDIVCLD